MTLTLITVVLWSAVIGWKLQRREQANGIGRAGARRADSRRDDAPRQSRRAESRRAESRRAESRRAESRRAEKRGPDRTPPKAPGKPTGPSRAVKAEVEINPGKCARFAFCEHEAPEIFKLTGDRIDYRTSVPADQIDAVAMAVKVCPARAIKLKVPGTKPYLPQPEIDDSERRPVRR